MRRKWLVRPNSIAAASSKAISDFKMVGNHIIRSLVFSLSEHIAREDILDAWSIFSLFR